MTSGIYIRTPEIREKIRKSLLGNIPWNKGKTRPPFSKRWREAMSKAGKGKKFTLEHKLKIGEALKGLKNYAWKGDKVAYVTLHNWVMKWKGKPQKCEICGTTEAKKYEWANVDHSYKRILEDYIRMCTKCHRKYDKEIN